MFYFLLYCWIDLITICKLFQTLDLKKKEEEETSKKNEEEMKDIETK